MFFKNFIILIVSIMLISCAGKKSEKISPDNYHGFYKVGTPYKIAEKEFTPKEEPEYDQVGMSSWYGTDFHGKKTANGDTFDKNSLTAAHNTLPLPSMVRVTNLENNKTLILMVNDRGPFSKGRIIDVSQRAAEILDFKNKGIAKVRVQFLKGHTKRLLADLPKEKSGFSLFKDNSVYADSIDDDKIMSGTPASTQKGEKEDIVVLAPAVAAPTNLAKPTGSTGNITVAKAIDSKKKSSTKKDVNVEQPIETVEVIDTEFGPAKFGPTTATDVTKPEAEVIAETKTIKRIEKHFIQAGTFSVKANAENAERALKSLGDVAVKNVNIGGKTLYRVRLGPIDNIDIAKVALEKIIKIGHPDAMLFSDMVDAE